MPAAMVGTLAGHATVPPGAPVIVVELAAPVVTLVVPEARVVPPKLFGPYAVVPVL